MNSILLDHLQKLVNEGTTIEEAVILILEYEGNLDTIVNLYKKQPFSFSLIIEALEAKGFVKIHTSPVYYEQSEQKINIPKNIKYLCSYSFCDCTSLEKITIPERFKDNMKYIFYEVNLTKVNITYI